MGMHKVLKDVVDERARQNKKWGEQDHGHGYWLGILVEEVGEVAQAYIQSQGPERVREELIQVAAVAIQWVEAMDRRDR